MTCSITPHTNHIYIYIIPEILSDFMNEIVIGYRWHDDQRRSRVNDTKYRFFCGRVHQNCFSIGEASNRKSPEPRRISVPVEHIYIFYSLITSYYLCWIYPSKYRIRWIFSCEVHSWPLFMLITMRVISATETYDPMLNYSRNLQLL